MAPVSKWPWNSYWSNCKGTYNFLCFLFKCKVGLEILEFWLRQGLRWFVLSWFVESVRVCEVIGEMIKKVFHLISIVCLPQGVWVEIHRVFIIIIIWELLEATGSHCCCLCHRLCIVLHFDAWLGAVVVGVPWRLQCLRWVSMSISWVVFVIWDLSKWRVGLLRDSLVAVLCRIIFVSAYLPT